MTDDDNEYDQAMAALNGLPLTPDEEQALSLTPLYPSLQAWVDQWFRPMFARHLGGQVRWCQQWWAHEEAILRLDNLWFSWEFSRSKPGVGLADWLHNHLDPQLQVLLGAHGPFGACERGEHNPPAPLPGSEPPSGWWLMDSNQRELALRDRNRPARPEFKTEVMADA